MDFLKRLGLVIASIFARRAAERVIEEVDDKAGGITEEEGRALGEALNPFGEEEE
jgi:hypothetical protein